MLPLELSDGEALDVAALARGHSYFATVQSESQRDRLLHQLSALQDAAVVACDGGLISNLTGWDNLSLPVSFHSLQVMGGLQQRARELFAGCGMADWPAVNALLGELPDEMSLYERRLVGFVRAMLVEPELMVYDTIYDNLARDDVKRVQRFDTLFHRYFPFRISVLLSFGEYGELAASGSAGASHLS